MKGAKQKLSRRLPKVVRILQARPKLIISIMLGVVAAFAVPEEWRFASKVLVGWNVGTLLYLAIIYWTIARSQANHIRQQAAKEDEGRGVILMLTVAAAMASLAAIIVELGGTQDKTNADPWQLLLAVTTIFLSWALIHSIFAVHYAYEFYTENRPGGGLRFPGDDRPGYWDFVYFSFVIGMTFQVSDVAVTARDVRATVTAHAIVSFLFNVTLIALVVNIAASAL